MKPGSSLRAVAELLLPAACLGCGGWIPFRPEDPEALVCGRCRSLLAPPPPPRCLRCDLPRGTGHAAGRPCTGCLDWDPELAGARTAVLLQGPASRLVHALKYEGWRRASGVMAACMASRIGPPDQGAVLVPVPTTAARLRTRGYNQAAELAAALSRFTSLPVVEGLVRRGGGPSQVALHPSQRRTNVRGAFGAPGAALQEQIQGRRILLVDDVLTTGATAREAAVALVAGGALEVTLLAFARALPGADARGDERR